MAPRPPSPDNSRSDVAAILMAMSQAPPRATVLDRQYLQMPGRFPVISDTDSVHTIEVSNSEDESMAKQAQIPFPKSRADEDVALDSVLYMPATSQVAPIGSIIPRINPRVAFPDDPLKPSLPHDVPIHRPLSTIFGDEHTKMGSSAETAFNVARPTSIGMSSQFGGFLNSRSRLPTLIPPDMIDSFPGPSPFSIETGSVPSPAQIPTRFQQAVQPLHKLLVLPHSQIVAMDNLQQTSQPGSDTRVMPDTSGLIMEDAHPAPQRFVQAFAIPPANMEQPKAMKGNQTESEPALSEHTKSQGRMRIVWRPQKHAVGFLGTNTAKRRYAGFDQEEVFIADFKYRTIKAIQMPARDDVAPDQDPPEPTPNNLPYGDDVDFQTSMLLHWLDEKEYTYTECARRFRKMFPGEAATDDTIRKKHHTALIKLAKKYGLKPEADLEEPSKSVTRRGQQAGHRYNTIGGKVVYSAGTGSDVAGTLRRKRVSEPTADRGFLKACICVWKDTSDVTFMEIQQRLAREYSWDIGANTVQKLYYQERGRVYDTYDRDNVAAADERGTELTFESSRLDPIETEELEETGPVITAT